MAKNKPIKRALRTIANTLEKYPKGAKQLSKSTLMQTWADTASRKQANAFTIVDAEYQRRKKAGK